MLEPSQHEDCDDVVPQDYLRVWPKTDENCLLVCCDEGWTLSIPPSELPRIIVPTRMADCNVIDDEPRSPGGDVYVFYKSPDCLQRRSGINVSGQMLMTIDMGRDARDVLAEARHRQQKRHMPI